MPPTEAGAGETVRAALARGAGRLEAAGVETPRLDAELLLAYTLGRDRTYLFGHPESVLQPEERCSFTSSLERRERREPLPYILGRWEFLGMSFDVTPAVLIPRPETETLVETLAPLLPPGARVLDVGAGCGCIGIGLAVLRPGIHVEALEPSACAAEIAVRNARRLAPGGEVRVLTGSFPDDTRHLTSLDAVVSNPPYIPSAELEKLAPELRVYEPRAALDGGPDGLELLRMLVSESPSLLRPGGLLALEVARGQSEQVAALLRSNDSWEEPELVCDLAGIQRVVIARSRGAGGPSRPPSKQP